MDFKEWFNLQEAFNSPLPIRWLKTAHDNWKGEFVVFDTNPKKYVLNMIKDDHMPWEVTFDLIQGKRKTQEITATGSAAKVFSTVLDGIKQWLNQVKPDAFALSAREPSRQSLYRRLLQMLPKKLWRVEDLESTFFVQSKLTKPSFAGFSDDDFADFYDDELAM